MLSYLIAIKLDAKKLISSFRPQTRVELNHGLDNCAFFAISFLEDHSKYVVFLYLSLYDFKKQKKKKQKKKKTTKL